jgi:hypothetical protein
MPLALTPIRTVTDPAAVTREGPSIGGEASGRSYGIGPDGTSEQRFNSHVSKGSPAAQAIRSTSVAGPQSMLPAGTTHWQIWPVTPATRTSPG